MLRRRNIRLYILVGAVLCILLYITLNTLNHDKQKENMRDVLPGSMSLQVKNVHFTEVDNSGISWELSADSATLMKKEKKSYFDNVRVKLTSAGGSVYTLTARKGSLRTDTKDIAMEGNVVIVADTGARFETESLNYSHERRNIHTKSAVAIKTPFVYATGSGMTIDLRESKLTILSGIRAQVRPLELGGSRT